MKPKPVFAFIDDARFELDNFRQNAAPSFEGVEFVYATTFEQAQAQLEERMPLCFLLDIYGSDPGQEDIRLPDPGSLEPVLDRPVAMADLYGGISQDQADTGEAGNQFLRRLYAQVEAWQAAFRRACRSLGQGNAYGLANLAAVRRHYPWAAALGYSRKALYLDAVEMSVAGADGVLQKPQGADDEAIARATREAAPGLARVAFAAVDRRLASLAGALGLSLCQEGDNLALAEALLEGVRHLDPSLAGEPKGSRAEAAQALAEQRLEETGLEPDAMSLILVMRRWLEA